jgi:hypothetical protein
LLKELDASATIHRYLTLDAPDAMLTVYAVKMLEQRLLQINVLLAIQMQFPKQLVIPNLNVYVME